jgi:hypothetical protein
MIYVSCVKYVILDGARLRSWILSVYHLRAYIDASPFPRSFGVDCTSYIACVQLVDECRGQGSQVHHIGHLQRNECRRLAVPACNLHLQPRVGIYPVGPAEDIHTYMHSTVSAANKSSTPWDEPCEGGNTKSLRHQANLTPTSTRDGDIPIHTQEQNISYFSFFFISHNHHWLAHYLQRLQE